MNRLAVGLAVVAAVATSGCDKLVTVRGFVTQVNPYDPSEVRPLPSASDSNDPPPDLRPVPGAWAELWLLPESNGRVGRSLVQPNGYFSVGGIVHPGSGKQFILKAGAPNHMTLRKEIRLDPRADVIIPLHKQQVIPSR